MTSRRAFLKASGALVIRFALGPRLALAQDRPAALPGKSPPSRRIDTCGTVASTRKESLPPSLSGTS